MKTFSGLDNFEINAPKKYYKHSETSNYRVFSDKNNPDAYDANFGVLKALDNVEDSIKHVEIAHEAAGAVPLFAYAPDSVSLCDAKSALEPHGYTFCDDFVTIMQVLPKASYKNIMPIACDVRMHSELTATERNFVLSQCDNQDYQALMLDRKLQAGAKYFCAYGSEKEPISNCTCEGYGEVFYISNVYTHEASRRRGFGRAVMCAALQYAYEKSYAAVFLHVSVDEARSLYERLGFVEKGKVNAWKAFKGSLPGWIIKNIRDV